MHSPIYHSCARIKKPFDENQVQGEDKLDQLQDHIQSTIAGEASPTGSGSRPELVVRSRRVSWLHGPGFGRPLVRRESDFVIIDSQARAP